MLYTEKAFDRINWAYLKHTFLKCGFQGNIPSAILALYSNPAARVFSDGVLSDPLNITNGTRQGCPLFPIFTEQESISGIPIAGQEYKITFFADDIILTLTKLASSLPEVCKVLDMFTACSFYKVNDAKSNILSLGLQASTKISL